MLSLEYTRLKLASWLAPSMAGYRKLYENAQAEVEGLQAIQKRDAMAYETLERLSNDRNNRLAAAGLKVTVQKAVLKAALPYVQDALDDVDSSLSVLSAKSSKRPALTAIKAAIVVDITAIKNVLEPSK